MEKIVCRNAIHTDLTAIVALWVEMMDFHRIAFPFPLVKGADDLHKEFIKQRIDSDECLILVAELNDEVVGYCRAGVAYYSPIYQQQPYGTIAELIVSQAYRRQGIGEKLYLKTKEWFLSQNIERIEVGTATNNPTSNAFWEKMGFETFRETKQLDL